MNRAKSKRMLTMILLLTIVAVIASAATYAYVINSLPDNKASLYNQQTVESDLEITYIDHMILPDKIVTTIHIYNPTGEEISANIYLSYEPDLKSKDFDVTIPSLDTYEDEFNVKLDVALFDGNVNVAINEYP